MGATMHPGISTAGSALQVLQRTAPLPAMGRRACARRRCSSPAAALQANGSRFPERAAERKARVARND